MTSIEWTDVTWNPVTGCTKVSPGCKNCYAERVSARTFAGQLAPLGGGASGSRPRRFTDVQCHPERLEAPLHWRKPRRVFVNSMSDLFHEAVPVEFVERVFAVMAAASQQTFQVLTKRPRRMRDLLNDAGLAQRIRVAPATRQAELNGDLFRAVDRVHGGMTAIERQMSLANMPPLPVTRWPLPNVWLGVSAENQETADERIPILLDTPAAVRFVSAEPLLGSIDLCSVQPMRHEKDGTLVPVQGPPVFDALRGQYTRGIGNGALGYDCKRLDWVIVGGESGPRARPCDVSWVSSILDQCKASGTACFIKQLGAVPRVTGQRWRAWPGQHNAAEYDEHQDEWFAKLRDPKGGDPAEWPEYLRVREFPPVSSRRSDRRPAPEPAAAAAASPSPPARQAQTHEGSA